MIRYIFICSRVCSFGSTPLISLRLSLSLSLSHCWSWSCSASPWSLIFKLNRFHQTMPNLSEMFIYQWMTTSPTTLLFFRLLRCVAFRLAHSFNVTSKNLFNIVMFENLNRSTPLDQIQVNKWKKRTRTPPLPFPSRHCIFMHAFILSFVCSFVRSNERAIDRYACEHVNRFIRGQKQKKNNARRLNNDKSR